MNSRLFRESKDSPTHTHKLVLLGDAAVGKSSLVTRFVKDSFDECQESTIGASFLTKSISLSDSNVKFAIWDTAGQERYHSLAPMYYRGASAAMVVYDITSSRSFTKAKTWVKELKKQEQISSQKIVIALVGNKLDLEIDRQVAIEDAKKYAEENELLFYEASAKSNHNISNIFKSLAEKIPLPSKKESNGLLIIPEPEPIETNKGCCKN